MQAAPAENARDVEDAAAQGRRVGQLTAVQLPLSSFRLLCVDLEHEHEHPLVFRIPLRPFCINAYLARCQSQSQMVSRLSGLAM
jgi:hypothetical protein